MNDNNMNTQHDNSTSNMDGNFNEMGDRHTRETEGGIGVGNPNKLSNNFSKTWTET